MITVTLIISLITIQPVHAYTTGTVGINTSLAVGYHHTLAIKKDGSLWAWGHNIDGQLGDGTTIDRSTPVKIMDNVATVSAGNAHTLAVKTDGTLWAWGSNYSGGLGDGTTTNKSKPVKIMDNVATVSAGQDHTLAVKTDGTLWAWGDNNWGGLGDGTTTKRSTPFKVMDNVATVSAGGYYSLAIKKDGSLWAWGCNFTGQLGDGTTIHRSTPVKIMDNVATVSAGSFHSLAIKIDGSLWAWGVNNDGELGDGTTTERSTPVMIMDSIAFICARASTAVIKKDNSLWAWGRAFGDHILNDTKDTPNKIMDNVATVSANELNTLAIKTDGTLWELENASGKQTPVKIDFADIRMPKQNTYLYDQEDPGASIVLPSDRLESVINQTTAINTVREATKNLTEQQKASATGRDLITLYAEEAVALSGKVVVEGSNVTLNQDTLSASATTSIATQKEAEKVLVSEGIVVNRTIKTAATMQTSDEKNIKVKIEDTAANIGVEELQVNSPTLSLAVPRTLVQTMGESGFEVSITVLKPSDIAYNPFILSSIENTIPMAWRNRDPQEFGTKYKIDINKPLKENIKISLPPLTGDPTYQAVVNSSGVAVGGKYNPATEMIEVKIKSSDTYMVKENKKDFSDIKNKSVEMQNAIKVLASKGIISGTTATAFSPDASITRAEIAALILRTLSKLDSNANGGFKDVKTSDWYYGVAGSAKQYGIMNGLSVDVFAPKNAILKEQIVAVSARTLKNEMNYKDPASVENLLNIYKDNTSLPAWGKKEIALATRENMVVRRTDSLFIPKATMTRGDAAVILYRLFSKIW